MRCLSRDYKELSVKQEDTDADTQTGPQPGTGKKASVRLKECFASMFLSVKQEDTSADTQAGKDTQTGKDTELVQTHGQVKTERQVRHRCEAGGHECRHTGRHAGGHR